MARGRRSAPARRWPFRLAVIGITAALVGGSAAIGLMGKGEPTAAPDTQPAATPGSKTGDGTAPSTASTASDASNKSASAADTTACLSEVAASEAVNVALRIATGHWQQHLGAWTVRLSSKSTAANEEIFDRTTRAGPADLKRLTDTDAAYAKRKGACAKLAGPRGESCRQRLAALDAASVPGHGSSNEWRLHLAAMAAKQKGVHDRHAWQTAYQTAPRNLNAFAAADAAVRVAPACDPV